MNIELIRYGSIPGKGTFGEIHIDGLRFFTVEREWLDNKKERDAWVGSGYLRPDRNLL